MPKEFQIECPRCGKTAITQPNGVLEYYDPNFECRIKRCLYRGTLHYISAEVRARVARAAKEDKPARGRSK